MSDTPPKAQVEDDQASKASSEATAPQASPKKNPGSQFHHHVVPTEHCGAINVYVQVRPYFSTNPTFKNPFKKIAVHNLISSPCCSN